MQPVLGHLQPRLSDDAHALLTVLVAALGSPEAFAKLDEICGIM